MIAQKFGRTYPGVLAARCPSTSADVVEQRADVEHFGVIAQAAERDRLSGIAGTDVVPREVIETVRATRRIRDHAGGRTYRRRQRADVVSRATDPLGDPDGPIRLRRARHSRARLPVTRRAVRSSDPR